MSESRVLIVCGAVHGHSRKVAEHVARALDREGVSAETANLEETTGSCGWAVRWPTPGTTSSFASEFAWRLETPSGGPTAMPTDGATDGPTVPLSDRSSSDPILVQPHTFTSNILWRNDEHESPVRP